EALVADHLEDLYLVLCGRAQDDTDARVFPADVPRFQVAVAPARRRGRQRILLRRLKQLGRKVRLARVSEGLLGSQRANCAGSAACLPGEAFPRARQGSDPAARAPKRTPAETRSTKATSLP